MTTTITKLVVGPVEYFRARLEYEIAPRGLKSILDRTPNNVHVVDVRERGEFDLDHIPGAWSVPVDALVSAFSSLPKDKMLVVCGEDLTDEQSARAALELAQKGFRVQRLIGGMAEWRRNGFPMETTGNDSPSQAW